HDDSPEDWRLGGPVALLLPGLCGAYRSTYMARTAAKLKKRGIRVFRMDYRACGAAGGMARKPYHAGLSEDVAEALHAIADLSPVSPVSLVGYSMGGNIALKLAGENLPENVQRVVAFSPAIDLSAAAAALNSRENRFYDRSFARYMNEMTAALQPG